MRRCTTMWALILILCHSGPQKAGAQDLVWASDVVAGGFNLCITPVRPSCVDAPETYTNKTNSGLCQDKMQDYTRATIVYRACMYREAERAVLQLNNALELFKCKIPQHDHCRGAPPDH